MSSTLIRVYISLILQVPTIFIHDSKKIEAGEGGIIAAEAGIVYPAGKL